MKLKVTQYEKLNFVNGSPPALNAATLNHIEDGISAATEGVTTVEKTAKDNKTDVDTALAEKADKTEVDKALAEKSDKATTLAGYGIRDGENISNKISDKSKITDEYANYPSIKYLDDYYYDFEETNNLLSQKYDSSNVETGSGVLNIPEGDNGKTESATFKYQRIGDYVDVSIYIVFNDFTTKTDTRVGYGNLPYVCEDDLTINGACAYNKKLVEWYVIDKTNGFDLKLPNNTIFIGGTNLTFNIKYRIA